MKNLLFVFALLSATSFAQVATGTPRYGSFSGGPDIINDANLNIHVSVPFINKPGRGLNFTYGLGFDNFVWKKVTAGQTSSWQPTQNWGWIVETQVQTGYIHYYTEIDQCQTSTGANRNYTVYTYDYYVDPAGVSHWIGAQVWTTPTACTGPPSQSTFSIQLSDGSGLNVTGGIGQTAKVTYPNGTVFVPPVNSGTGGGSGTDSNGNQITVASGVYTDTLGSTVLTIAGSGTQASPKTYTYTDANGSAQTVTVNYQNLHVETNFGCSGITDYGTNGTTTADFVSSIVLPNGTHYDFNYEPTPGLSNYYTGRLASVTLPTGGTITYTYSGGDTNKGIYCDDGSTSYLDRATSDGTTYYRREHVDAFGHWKTTLIYPTSDQTVIHFQKVQNSSLFVETERDIYNGGPPPGSGTLKARSISCYNTCPNGKGGAGLGDAVALPITVIDTDNYTDNNRIAGTWASFDSFGARTQLNEYDFGAPGGSRGLLGRYTTATYTTLTNGPHVPTVIREWDTAGGPPDTKVSEVTYTYDGGTLTPTSAVQHVTPPGARGNVTSVTRWSNGAQTPDPAITYTYFDTGMVKSVTDPAGHVTNFDYSDNFSDAPNVHNAFAFVKTVTNQLGQIVATNKYYWPSGALQEAKDSNNQTTSFTYDSMLRPLSVAYPNGGNVSYTYTDSSNEVQVQTLVKTGLNQTIKSKVDSYGRASRSAAYNGTNYEQQDTCYDNMGRVVFVSGPYQDAGFGVASKCASFVSDPTHTEGAKSQYDTLGRVISTTVQAQDPPGGAWVYRTTGITYTGNSVKVEDAGNGTTTLKKISRYDGLGRLIDVCEVSATTQQGTNNTPADCQFDVAGTGFKTSYTYDVLDHLKQVTQGGLTNRTYSYNGLGQLTSVTTPESGTANFTYDTDGLTHERVRAKANQVNTCPFSAYDSSKCTKATYAYDGIHRLLSVTYDDTTPAVNFTYDLASDSIGGTTVNFTNPTGRLSRATVGQTKNWFSYDSMGRALSNWQTLPPQYASNAAYQLQYTYHEGGAVKTLNNSYDTITYDYDALARLTSASSSWSDSAHPALMFSSPGFGRFGLISYIAGASINSGIQTVLSPNNFGELTSKSATDAGGSGTTRFSMGSMSYAPNGMLTAATVNSSGWSHAYDDIGRILTSQNGSTVTYGFDYDRYGNRAHQSVTAGSGNSVTTPSDNTTNKIASGNGITYDALGNITNDGSHAYTFDAENRIIQVDGGSTATYVYDAFNRRVQKTTSSGTLSYTYDVGNNVAVVYSGTSTPLTFSRAEVFMGSHLATYTSSHTYFHHQNWLGSRATTTDETGAKVQDCEWNPFGDLKACTTNTDLYAYTPYGYADYERDSETGLDHMQFRYYNSRIGRFMSADLLSGDSGDPQSINKFGYVINNPINLFDAFGLDDCPAGQVAHLHVDGPPTCGPRDPGFTDDDPPAQHTGSVDARNQADAFVCGIIGEGACGGVMAMTSIANITRRIGGQLPAPPNPPPPEKTTTTCAGTATFTAVGGNQAQANGALYSQYPAQAGGSIRGGTFGTVAVQKGFLGLSTRQLRTYGTQIYVMPSDQALIHKYGGPTGPLSVSDYGDANIQATSGVAFDLYRFPTVSAGMQFGKHAMNTTISFPTKSGGSCPNGFTVVP